MCVPANCHIDADCGSYDCSPSYAEVGQAGLQGYCCHTANDRCPNDSDCSNDEPCSYGAELGYWTCTAPILTF